MKSIDDARAAVCAHVERKLVALTAEDPTSLWPWKLSLGRHPTKAELQQHWEQLRAQALEWNRANLPAGVRLQSTHRLLHGIRQAVPSAVEFDSLDAAAGFAGRVTVQSVAAARQRWAVLSTAFPATASPEILGKVLAWPEVDVGILLAAGHWFSRNDPTGMTLRQVPVEGMHTKWLTASRALLVAQLAARLDDHGAPNLRLTPRLRQPVHFHYRDPTHLASPGRAHDSWTPGDAAAQPPYRPQLVVICENKDTAATLTPTPGLISVEGAGYAGAASVASLAFLPLARHVVYWGDIDIDGYAILDRYRGHLEIDSILMDAATFTRFQAFASAVKPEDAHLASQARTLRRLREPEASMYKLFRDPTWHGSRRLEQERIPIAVASQALIHIGQNSQV